MTYRDDREALMMEVDRLERENAALTQKIEHLSGEVAALSQETRSERRSFARGACVACGGTSLHAVAVFAGHNHHEPIPLSLSTTRFGDPTGGFNRSAPLKFRVCSTCGFVHTFMDIEAPEAAEVTGSFRAVDIDLDLPVRGGS